MKTIKPNSPEKNVSTWKVCVGLIGIIFGGGCAGITPQTNNIPYSQQSPFEEIASKIKTRATNISQTHPFGLLEKTYSFTTKNEDVITYRDNPTNNEIEISNPRTKSRVVWKCLGGWNINFNFLLNIL